MANEIARNLNLSVKDVIIELHDIRTSPGQ